MRKITEKMMMKKKNCIKYFLYILLSYLVFQGVWAFVIWRRNMSEIDSYAVHVVELAKSEKIKHEDLEKELDEGRTYFVIRAGYENAQGFIVNRFVRAMIFNPIFITINNILFRPLGMGF
jgi:hypothetical protein